MDYNRSYKVKLPCVLGMEGAGEVVGVGEGVTRFARGNRVAWCIAWGSYAEYSFDIDYIPASTAWEAWSTPAENSLYLWGPDVPADFVRNHETQSEGGS